MIRSPRRRSIAATALALPLAVLPAVLVAPALRAAEVTVSVTPRAGGSAENTVIILDPLDAVAPAGHDGAVIDQINKQFVPRVTVVRTGTAITFPNSDNIRHQVYSFSHAKTFTLKLYAGSPHTPVVFDHAGLVVLGCNIHDSMVGFVGVVDSPYFARTTDSGVAALDVPAGRYRMRVWNPHATAAVAAREITVSAAPLSVPVSVELSATGGAVAPWPE